MKAHVKMRFAAVGCFLVLTLSATNATGSVIGIGPGSFPSGSTLINFNGLANGTEVNGLTVTGVQFVYSISGIPTNGALVIDGGPGVTNNVSPPNIVSLGNPTGTLTMMLPGPATVFGYGFAILTTAPVFTATTISVFDGATPLGSISYPALVDPLFAGGFAGIESTIPFNRVQATFAGGPAFAVDNIQFAASSVPEPSTLILLASGLAYLPLLVRRGVSGTKEKTR